MVMSKPAPKSKSAMDKLVDSFSELVAEAKERMSDEEFRQAEKKFDEIISRVRASRGGRRETA
jgi:outer membrane protein assembly factor BamD (BamD/ComL family)